MSSLSVRPCYTVRLGPNHILELGCDHCELSAITVLNPSSTGACEKDDTCSHNTDAVDVHGDPFWIHGVNFTTGDDNVAGHANNTLVEDSYFGTGPPPCVRGRLALCICPPDCAA